MIKKTILKRYFDEILESGHGVPRDKEGYTLTARVSEKYTLICSETKRELNALCTQTHPVHFKTTNS